MNFFLLLSAFIFSFTLSIKATTVNSVCSGNWTNPYTWDTGNIPSTTDTVNIFHNVILDVNVMLVAPGTLNITNTGSLCGNYNFDGQFLTNGQLKVFLLTVEGYSISNVWVTAQGTTVNGTWVVNGGACASGCAPSCGSPMPCNNETSINNKNREYGISIYPNPTSDQFFIDANTSDKLTVDLFDVNGRHVFSASVMDKSNINVTTLDEGIYTMTIKSVDRVTNKKLVIAR